MAQTFSLYPDLTVEENFRFFAGVYGVCGSAATRRMDELFEQIELAELRDVQAGRLSGGMKQRLALACALVHEPELVFLDEPTAGVDPAQRQRLWDFLYALCEGGTSLFVTTHYLDEAERCHAVGFMLDGRLIAHGEPARAARAAARSPRRRRGRAAPSRRCACCARCPGSRTSRSTATSCASASTVASTGGPSRRRSREAAARAGVPLDRVYPLDPTLEDLFLSYERRGAATA